MIFQPFPGLLKSWGEGTSKIRHFHHINVHPGNLFLFVQFATALIYVRQWGRGLEW